MRSKVNRIIVCSLLTLTALITFPQVTHAASESKQNTQNTVVVRDPRSQALIFKNRGVYFFGYNRSNQIIKEGPIAPGELIVKTKSPANTLTLQGQSPIKSIIDRFSGKTKILNENLGLALVQLPKDKDYFDTLQALKSNPNVEYAEPNFILKADLIPNDPYYNQEWGPKAIHADTAWEKVLATKRASVTIAILDTGVNAAHEDLRNSIVPGYNFVNNSTNTDDVQGHGTHVSGIAAAVINNSAGIAGISGSSKIMPVKVLDDSGSGSVSHIIAGIKYAADHGAQVISLSLGGAGTSSAMQDAINYATSRGVGVVAASGNENGPVNLPGNCQNVITVGAVDSNLQRASYSNYGPEMDVAAPGSQIFSTYIGGSSKYANMSGTSMATPFVSGVVALLKAVNPNLTPSAITDILRQSAGDQGTAGFDNYYGYGLVNADKAVDLALKTVGSTPAPAPTPTPSPAPTPAPTPVPTSNLALNRPARASSIEGLTRNAEKAFDGNTATRWASREGIDPQWIYVDLGKTVNITKIVLNWEKAYAKSYRVQTSYDAVNWTTVFSTTSGTGGIATLTGSIYGRYVRVYGTQRGLPYGYSLWEFEVYGK